MSMSVAIESIRQEIMPAIQNDELVLPSMPEAALRVREAADDPDASIASICEVIGADAAVAARVIKVANSALFRSVNAVDNLQFAVSRMGIPYTTNLAVGVAMEQLFQATSEAVDKRMRESWSHSTEVASLCHVYCQFFTRLKPDQATLAGLVHEIGKLPILAWADENDWDEETIDSTLAELHPELGAMILEKWDFPQVLQEVPLYYLDFGRQNDAPDYVDLVTVANLHAYAGKHNPFADVDLESVTAFDHLGISVDEVMADDSEFMEEAGDARGLLG
jgi:HD-like signal output (HDOD) protein